MELLDFFQALLPASGSYALFSVPRRKHVWAPTFEKLVACANRVSGEAGWYFATASFDGEGSRTQDHVVAKKCLYLDLDAGAEKYERDPNGVYATNADARKALLAFYKALDLPPSMVVHSGAGLHVYWVLDNEISAADWKPLAKALGEAAKAHGLRADSSCTTDSARILRHVGALHKNGNRVKVLVATGATYSVEHLSEKLAVEEEQFGLTAVPRRALLDVNAQLTMFEPTPTSALKVAEKCTALREVANLLGDVDEPRWRSMIGIVKHCVEGVNQAHEWSRGHPDYDPEETEEKFDRYSAGPTTCDHFRKQTRACQGCEHTVKSPIVLGRLTVAQVEALPEELQPEDPQLFVAGEDSPFVGVNFGDKYRPQMIEGKWRLMALKVTERDTDDGPIVDKRWVRIADDVFWAKGWVEAGAEDNESAMVDIFVHHNSMSMTRSSPMPASSIASSNDLNKWLYGRGITKTSIDASTNNLMHNYVNHQFNVARTYVPRLAVRRRFGLQYDHEGHNANLICAHGRYIIRADGSIEEAVVGKTISEYTNTLTIKPLPYSPTGTWKSSVWRSHIRPAAEIQLAFFRKYYDNDTYAVAQLAVMLSLSSPFMLFAADTHLTPGANLPNLGLTVSLYSTTSGQGKTSMQKAVASCYGDPAKLVMSGSVQDSTPAYQTALLAVLGTMPCFFDEVTQNNPQEVGQLINRVAGGSGKGRANQSGDARSVKSWALMTTISTNVPQREMLAMFQQSSDALQMRLIELTCEFPKVEGVGHVDYEQDRDDMLAPNYGALGAMINYMIVRAGPVRMRKFVQDRLRIAAELIKGSSQRERFMQRGMACVLACHDCLESIGMTMFNKDTLIAQYVSSTKEAVEYSTAVRVTPEDSLRRMISDFSPFIVVTHGDRTRAGDPHRIEPVVNRQQLRSPYVGRRIESEHTVFLMADAVRTWCADHQLSFSEVVAHGKRTGVFKPIDNESSAHSKRMKITRGTDLSTVSGACFAVDESMLFGDSNAVLPPNVVVMRRASPPQPSQEHPDPAPSPEPRESSSPDPRGDASSTMQG